MKRDLEIEGQQQFDEYILVAPGSDYGRAMWSDIEKLPNGRILEGALRPTNKFLRFLHHAHFSFAINQRIRLPFQSAWRSFYSLEQIEFDAAKSYCVIFTDISAARTDRGYLKKLHGKENVTAVLVMVNTMARRGPLIESRQAFFDCIFSFDKKDCEAFGFLYHPTNYSMVDIEHQTQAKTDAFYVGVSKGRGSTIAQVFTRLSSMGATADFYVSHIEAGEGKAKGIHYNEWLSYRQVLEHIQACNCVVEIMDGAQEGVTLRTMEAICYNKKLLTNNPAMKDSRYYLSGNIQVFSDPTEIDVAFVMDKTPVDYLYDGEFSPVHLLEHINQVEAEKAK